MGFSQQLLQPVDGATAVKEVDLGSAREHHLTDWHRYSTGEHGLCLGDISSWLQPLHYVVSLFFVPG